MTEPGRIYFSITQRRVLSPNDFTDIDTVAQRLADFEERYNQTARPFKWKFTATDLAEFLDRLDRHQPPITTNPAQPRAAGVAGRPWCPSVLEAGG